MRFFKFLGVGLAALTLAGCGGGSGGGSGGSTGGTTNGSNAGNGGNNTPQTLTYPTFGNYTPVFRLQGTQRVGVSLVHASTPSVEYVVDAPSSAPITTGFVLVASQPQSGNIFVQPGVLIYVQAGAVNMVNLAANGSKPQVQQINLGSGVSACAIPHDQVIDGDAQTAQLIVTTPGADGQCNTADDGELRVTLAATANNAQVENPGPGFVYVGYVFSGTASNPNAWIMADTQGNLYYDQGAGPNLLQSNAGTSPTSLSQAGTSLLLRNGNSLETVFFSAGQWQIKTLATVDGSWQFGDADVNEYYVYGNSSSGGVNSWQLAAIDTHGYLDPVLLGRGPGSAAYAAAGLDQVFVSSTDIDSNYLYQAPKSGTGAQLVETVARTANGETTLDRVYPMAGGCILLNRQLLNGTTLAESDVATITEGSAASIGPTLSNVAPILEVVPGSFAANTLGLVPQISMITDYQAGVGTQKGAHLQTLDGTTCQLIDNGALPDPGALGAPGLYVGAGNAYDNTGGLFVGGLSNGAVSGTGAGVYEFDPGQPGSLMQTLTQQ